MPLRSARSALSTPRPSSSAFRMRERAVLSQVEAAYITPVAARRKMDAVAADGERLHEAKARAWQGCVAESDPQTSALRYGVGRVRVEDTPTA